LEKKEEKKRKKEKLPSFQKKRKKERKRKKEKMILTPEREFYDCCRFGDLLGVTRFLERGENGEQPQDAVNLDVNSCNTMFFGYTAFHAACENGHLAIVQMLMNHAEVNIDVKVPKKLWTPLFLACWVGQTEVVDELLLQRTKMVDVNSPSVDGYTPLTIALVSGRSEVVRHLLASGRALDFAVTTNTKCREGAGKTVMEIALTSLDPNIHGLLERYLRDEAHVRWELQIELGFGGSSSSSFLFPLSSGSPFLLSRRMLNSSSRRPPCL
jgi:hypothetical protein